MSSFKSIAFKVKNDRAAANDVAVAAHQQNIKASTSTTSESANSNTNFSGLVDVAAKVVQTQREARGLTQMWMDSSESDFVIHGIHLEKKKLDLTKVAAERKEEKRSQFYQELLVYIIFLAFFYMLLSWLPVNESFEQSNVVQDLICTNSNACDIETLDGLYQFSEHTKNRICGNPTQFQWKRVGQVRLRQVRVSVAECLVSDTQRMPCYPCYTPELEDKLPIEGLDSRVYIWMDGLIDLNVQNNSYGTGGYVVDLCEFNTSGISALIQDEWISIGTRAVSIEFTLVNPVTQMYTIGLHMFTISPSGNLKHYPQGANIRIISKNDADAKYLLIGDVRVFFWLCCIVFFLTYARAEYNDVSRMGLKGYLISDGWNLFEIVQLSFLGYLLYLFYVYYNQCATTLKVLHKVYEEELDHVNMQPLLHTFQKLRDVASIASAISILKVFKFLRMNATLNLPWQVLGGAMQDLMGFLVIFNIIFVSYSCFGKVAFGFALEEFSTLSNSYGTCFKMLAGAFDYDQLRQANPLVAPFFFGSFVVLVLQILVNMFVAILSEYYEVAKKQSRQDDDVEYDLIRRVKLYLEACAPFVVLPENQPIEIFQGQTVRLISTHLIDQEVVRQRAKKLFRGVVWRVIALLRLGVRFDRRLMFGDRAEKKNKKGECSSKMLHIPLSSNFDHRNIQMMLPTGITVRLEGDSLLGSDILLKVLCNSSLSIECMVIGSTDKEEDENSPLELLGGEYLRIPWYFFVLHVLRMVFHEIQIGIMRATKIWNPLGTQLIDDYHLCRLLDNTRKDGRTSLRYDELYRILDLFIRKEHRKQPVPPNAVRRETAQVMYQYRNSLIDMPSREKEGHDYRPNPIDTSQVELGALEYLSEMLAENCHEIWALDRIKQGWVYGPSRECEGKTTPNLVPYHKLSKEEQGFDCRASMETLKTILSLNFQIVRNPSAPNYLKNTQRTMSGSSNDARRSGGSSRNLSFALRRLSTNTYDSTSPYFVELEDGELYYPRPVGTSQVELPARLAQLVDLLAENAHEVWSKGRMDEGWTYGAFRSDKNKAHPCLVPYVFLTDEEKVHDVNTAMGTLKHLMAMGFNVVNKESRWGQ